MQPYETVAGNTQWLDDDDTIIRQIFDYIGHQFGEREANKAQDKYLKRYIDLPSCEWFDREQAEDILADLVFYHSSNQYSIDWQDGELLIVELDDE